MQYGWHGWDALEILLEERHKQDTYQRYMTAVGCGIMKGLGNADFPTYTELIGETPTHPKDTRSGQAIVDDLRQKLLGKGESNSNESF